MLLHVVRVSSGFFGFYVVIFRLTPSFHLTIMVPPNESSS